MLRPSKARVVSPIRAAASARRQLAALSRRSGSFDASRYFRGAGDLGFLNVGTETVRAMARGLVRDNGDSWSMKDGLAFANALISDRYLEVKGVGIEVLARYRREFTPDLLPVWKRWLAKNYSANWATTDAICGLLIGPLLVEHPRLVRLMLTWSRAQNMWVRRASAVALIPTVRRGLALDVAYEVARRLHSDRQDLLQKAVGWMLREAGKVDDVRLERYLRANGPSIPRTSVRYAIERFPPARRAELLAATRNSSGRPEGRNKKTLTWIGNMGAETTCAVTFKGKTSTAKVRLETSVLQIRGSDLKLDLAFSAMKSVAARDGSLLIGQAGGALTLRLGASASRWADKILHPPSRLTKIGARPEWRTIVIGDVENDFVEELRAAVNTVSVGRMAKEVDAVFVGVSNPSDFKRLSALKALLKPSGAVWLIRPKGNPEVTEGGVMAAGKAAGLVDVKVMAFSTTHSALKFVIPVKDRRRS